MPENSFPLELERIVRNATLLERLASIGLVLGVALVTWLIARVITRRLRGKTKFGLHALERLPAPLTLLAAVMAATWISSSRDEPASALFTITLEVLGVGAGFWLAARIIDVVWATGVKSARLRAQPASSGVLLIGRYVGKLLLVSGALTVLAVRLGASEQLYLVLTGLAAAVAFAARDPIRNAVAFMSMVFDPPFRMNDRVRIVDFRGGEEVTGEVIGISFLGTTVRTRARTHVMIANVELATLRVENLSAANRRRCELALPISSEMRAEALREACDTILADLRESELVSKEREATVWIAGIGGGLTLKASYWLRRGLNCREAQRELFLATRSRLEALEREEREKRRKPKHGVRLPHPLEAH